MGSFGLEDDDLRLQTDDPWSYELLSAREQVVFRRLAVFIDGWSIAAAEAVCSGAGIQSEEILDAIERLVERSLVQVEESAQPARFRLLETVRQFAAERLEASDDVRLCRKQHLEWYVGLADGVSPQLLRGEDVEVLEHDYNNLRSALRSAIDLGTVRQHYDWARACGCSGTCWVSIPRGTRG